VNVADIDTDLLPPILQDIVAQIGLHPTMLLVQARGGVRLYVPKLEMDDGHYLVVLLGREPAEKLQKMYGGDEHFDIPKAERALLAVRNSKIRHARAAGASVSGLALEYHLTERQIRTICGELIDDRQVSLF
jgi:hypothetical protein